MEEFSEKHSKSFSVKKNTDVDGFKLQLPQFDKINFLDML